jgi:hypothetical protein
LNADNIIQHLNIKLNQIKYYQPPLTWFDAEFNKVLGIDIYQTKFDMRGFQFYRAGRYKALIVRLESFEEVGADAIEGLLGENLALKNIKANVRKKSNNGSLYEEVIRGVKIDETVIQQIYNSKFVQYFYPDPMIKGFIKRWSKN